MRTILLKTSYGMKDSAIILDLPKSKAYNTFKNQLWDESEARVTCPTISLCAYNTFKNQLWDESTISRRPLRKLPRTILLKTSYGMKVPP